MRRVSLRFGLIGGGLASLGLLWAAISRAQPNFDSDGDGSPDAVEHFLGTNPQDRQSVFALRGLELISSPTRARLRWPSTAGLAYRVESTTTLAGTSWQTVATLTGTGALITHDVPLAAGEPARFFRVRTDYDTARPPWVGAVESPGATITQPGFIPLRLQAWHPAGLDEVLFMRGARVLGAASPVVPGGNLWQFDWAPDSADNGAEPITALARQGGASTQTLPLALTINISLPPQPAYLAQNLDQFVLLDPAGKPRANSVVRADATGNLPSCEFRPTGFSLEGNLAAIGIRLPQGARITGAAGSEILSFNQSTLVSGANSPIRITGTPQTNSAKTLALGPVPVSTLLTLYGLPAGGLPVSLLGRFPATLETGTFAKDGLRAPRFALAEGTLPFGAKLGGFAGAKLDLGDDGGLLLPLAGSFPLSQGDGAAATLSILPARPAWLRLGLDGSLRLRGQARLEFADGPRFDLGLTLDDPVLGLEFRAGKLHASTTGAWLRPRLPAAATINAGTSADAATLASATRLLSSKAAAFDRYAASFPAGPELGAPRGDTGAETSPLEVIGLGKIAGATGLTAVDAEFRQALDHAARAAAAARDTAATARFWLDLERLHVGGLTSNELTAARAEARAALQRRLTATGTPLSLEEIYTVLGQFTARWKLAQQLNVTPDSTQLEADLAAAILGAVNSLAASLGVVDNVFLTPSAGIQSRSRFVLYQDIASLIALERDSALLGLDLPPEILLDELLAQSALHLERVLRAALDAAERSADEMAFRDALAEYLFLAQQAQLGAFGGVTLPLLDAGALSQRCGAMALASANLPRPARPVGKLFQEISRLSRILDSIPGNVTFPAPPAARAHDSLNDALAPAFSVLGSATRAELLDLVLAGNASARLRDQMGFAAGTPAWENPARLSAAVDALAAKCSAEDDAGSALTGALSLFDLADRLTQPADQARRKTYLLEAQKLVTALRAIALAREAAAPPATSDGILAGGITIDEIAGGLTYRADTEALDGRASGQVRLPGLGANLTLARASFSTGGAFDLELHGGTNLPPGSGGSARFSVTPRRPLRFGWRAPDRFTLAGGGRLEVNGMSFEAWAALDDPRYTFGARAAGLDFDLADSLRIMLPTWPAAPAFAPAVQRDLNRYFTSVARGFEEMNFADALPHWGTPGEVPQDLGQPEFMPFTTAEAVANTVLVDAFIPAAGRDYTATFAAMASSLDTLGRGLESVQGADCATPAGRVRLRQAVRFLDQAERALTERPFDPALLPLQTETTRLRTRLGPMLACATQLGDDVPIKEQNERLMDLQTYGAGSLGADGAVARIIETVPALLGSLGLDPATGGPVVGRPVTVKPAELPHIVANLQMRLALVELSSEENTPVSLSLPRATQVLIEAAWDPLIDEGLAIIAEDDRIRAARATYLGSASDGYFPAEHPVARASAALGARAREWADLMTMREALEIKFSNNESARPVRRLDGTTGPYAGAGLELVFFRDRAFNREAGTSADPIYAPVKVRVAGPPARDSQPFLESFENLRTPYAEQVRTTADLRASVQAIKPADTAAPEVQLAWRRAVAISHGIPVSAVVLPDSAWAALLARVEQDVAAYAVQPSLATGLELAGRIRNLLVRAQRSEKPAVVAQLKVRLAALDAVFRPLVTARRAWWHLGAYTDLIIAGSEAWGEQTAGGLGAFFVTQANTSLQTGFALLGDLKLLLPSARPFDLALPGDLRIDEVFGEVRFDHSTGLLSGDFGGRLRFPDLAASFAINSLTLDNAGNLAISASAAGPLPLAEGVRLDGTLALAGRFGLGAPGQPPAVLEQFTASGAGTATLPSGTSFNGTFGYDTTTRIFSLSGGGSNLGLSLGDHFALLSGQASLKLGGVGAGALPASGQIDLGGTFGFLRKASPPVGQPLTPDHFHLAAVEATARLAVSANTLAFSLPQGRLLLPEAFQSPPVAPATQPTRAELAINPALPPTVTFTLGAADANGLKPLQQVTFAGGVTFAHLGLVVPSFADAGAREFTGAFDFGGLALAPTGAITAAQAPKLTITNGFFFFPHPLDQTRIELQAANVQWKLDGFPVGTLRLATDVDLFNEGGFTLTLLGAPGVNTTGLELLAPSGGATLPSLRLFGQLRALMDNTLLVREAGSPVLEGIPTGRFGAVAAGQLTLHAPVGNALPVVDFSLADVGILGDFRIGGAGGVRVTGLTPGTPASITLSGLGNLFNLADQPGRQFVITLDGKIVQSGLPGFGLGNAKFVFFDPAQPPRFVPDTLVYDGSSWTLAQQLPVELRSATLRFINGSLPPSQLLQPQNFEITSTFRLGFPSVEEPVLGGGADGVRVTFAADGTPQLQNLEGIELTLDPGINIPPIEELGGTVYVTGLSNPANLLLAGRIGGSMNGYKLKFIAAFRTTGPLGLAVDFNAGSAGIPLGPTGFLFTGAGGGISFLNTSADPTDLRSYVQEVGGKFVANPTNPPPSASMTWTGFRDWGQKLLDQAPVFPPIGTGPPLGVIAPGTYPANDPIGCPVNIPPASANILGMPHPDQTMFPGRYVLKFSSIPEDTLNKPLAQAGMGITEDSITALGQSGEALAITLAAQIRDQIESLTPAVPAALGSGAQEAASSLLAEIELGLAELFEQALATLPVDATSAQLYAAIRDKAYAGVPVQDATFAVKGVFTHAAISAFMNVEGGGTIGTTGSAGVTGAVNFLGVPVGQAKLFLSATDANGNPNPQLTGDMSMALGPLEFGSVKAVLKAEGAVTGLAAVTGQIATTLGQTYVGPLLGRVNPDYAGLTLAQAQAAVVQGVPSAEQAAHLAAFQVAFMAQVLREPPGTLPDSLLGQIASLLDQVNPELVICSDASMKFAGLKLSNGLASFKFRMRKTGREAHFDIAPAGFIGYGTPIAALTSGIDRASMAYAETFPDVTGLLKSLLNGSVNSPETLLATARAQTAAMLENGTMTGTYQVNPLGMNLFRAQARLIFPDLTAHPVVRNNNASPTDNWVRPGTGTLAALPTREALLLAAVEQNALGDVFWKGNGNNLPALFGNLPALQGRTLTHDYFPHGGLALASMLEVPRIFTNLPKTELATLANGAAAPLDRLEAFRSILADYFGTTVRQGDFMAYVPLPNPPALFGPNGQPLVPPPPELDPLALLESLKTFDPATAQPGPLWDIGESFAYLHLRGEIVDIPIGEVNLTAVGPNLATGAPAMFSGLVSFPAGSWTAVLLGNSVQINAKVAGQARPERRNLATAFSALGALDTFGPTPDPTAVQDDIADLATSLADVLAQDLPRVELGAAFTSFTPPATWGWAGELVPVGGFTLAAYSPEFLPTLPAGPTDLQRLQKTGGVSLAGQFKFANWVTADARVLLEPPTSARLHPRAIATFDGGAATLPAPFGLVGNAALRLDTESATFFSLTGQLAGSVNLGTQLGWPVTIPAGATVTVTNQTAAFTFTLNGASATVTANYADPLAPTFSFAGVAEFDPLVTGAFSIIPQSGAKLRVTIDGATASLTNARIAIGAPFSQAANLPAISVTSALNFASTAITAPLNNVSLAGFTTNGLTWRVSRVGGVLAVTNVQGSVATTALGAGFATAFGGNLASDGTFSFTGTTTAGGSFTGLPVSTLATNATLTFTPTALTFNGAVGGDLLGTGVLPGASTMANVTVTVTPAAVTQVAGSVSVSAARLGGIEIRPTSGGNFTLTLSNAGLAVPAGRIFFTPASTTTSFANSPALTLPRLNGSTAILFIQSTATTGNFAGFALSNLSFILQRTATTPPAYRITNIAFNTPVPTGFSAANFSVSGGSLDGQTSAANLPLVSLPALTVGRFTLGNASSSTPTLSTAGLSLPAPQLSSADLGLLNRALPGAPLVIPAAGNFTVPSFSAGTLTPSLGSLAGFSLGSANFGVNKTGSSLSLTGFTATLPVPGFTANTLALNGTIPSSGAISLAAAGIPQLANGLFTVKGPSGGAITSTFSSTSGLVFNAGQLDVANLFAAPANFASTANFTVPSSTASDTTFASFTASPSLRGFALGVSTFSLQRVGGALRLNVTAGALPLPSGPTLANFNGTVSATGAVSLTTSLGGADFYGFPVSAGFTLANDTTPWNALLSDSEPLAWWRMDESGSTTVLTNASAFAPSHQGSTTSSTTRPALQQPSGFQDASGVSMRFDGVDDFYSVPDNSALEGGSAMSVACWFRVDQFTAGKSFHTLVAKGDDSWRLAQDGTANYLSFDTNSASSGHALRASTVAVNDGKWHHVVATYDGATKRLYIDGVLRAAETWTGPIRDSAHPVGIGHNPQAANRHWNGWIDEVVFWNLALAPGRIHAMYQRGNGLALAFSGQVNLRGDGVLPVAQQFRPAFFGTLNTAGEFDLSAINQSATLLGFGFNDIDLVFQRRLLPAPSVTLLGAATLNTLPGAPFASNPRFTATFTRSGGVTTAALSAPDLAIALADYVPAAGGFDLSLNGDLGVTRPMNFADFRFGQATLAGLGLPALSGTLITNGSFAITSPFLDSITLAGFTAPGCGVDFTEDGLVINGDFDLDVSVGGFTRDFGDISLYGVLAPNGSYAVTGSGTLQIGAYSTDPLILTLSSSTGRITASGAPNLNFGPQDISIGGFYLTAGAFSGTMNKSFGPLTANHLANHLETTFSGTTTLSYSFSSGLLTGGVSGTWSWTVKNFSPPGGFNPGGSFSISGGIGDNGSFSVNNGTAAGDSFFAPFWTGPGFSFDPPPFWTYGTLSDESYELW